MAKAKSHLMSIIRGSVAGVTYLSGPDHQLVMRQRTTPVNPQTTRQSQMRSEFSGAAARWNALTPNQRRAWEQYAETVTIENPVDNFNPSGRSLFIGNISTREYLTVRGVTFSDYLDTAPLYPGRLVVENLDVIPPASSHTGFQIQVTNPNPEGIYIYAFISPVQNPARNTYQGQFQTESLQFTNIASLGSGVVAFDVGLDDQVYFCKVRLISEEAGFRTSALFQLRCIVSTTV
jgi:hypothetical protein